MCEALVFIRNNVHADPERDRSGSYKVGMIVAVFEDGHVWGREESKQVWISESRDPALWPGQGKWAILKVPGAPAAKAEALMNRQTVDDVGTAQLGLTGLPLSFRRREWRLLFASVPVAIRNAALADGEVTVTVANIRNFLRRIRDDAQYTGLD